MRIRFEALISLAFLDSASNYYHDRCNEKSKCGAAEASVLEDPAPLKFDFFTRGLIALCIGDQ